MAGKHSDLEHLPPNSLRAEQAQRRESYAKPKGSFGSDTHAAGNMNALGAIIVTYVFLVFITFTIFTQVGLDATSICADTTNFSAEDCAGAEAARAGFWVVQSILLIATLIMIFNQTGLVKIGRK